MTDTGRTLLGSAVVPIRLLFLMWLVLALDMLYGIDLSSFGILPRSTIGLIGIFAAPILHGGVAHLVSNTVPFLFLGVVLFYFYYHIANRVFFSIYFITNILVWLMARPAIHIGASGLVYGLAAFLIFHGFFQRNFKSLFISLVVMILYGSIFYGVLPLHMQISWESHLMGAISGIFIAWFFRKNPR